MGLKLHTLWFSKINEEIKGEAYSADLGDDDSIIETLDLPLDDTINAGFYDVTEKWVPYLQTFFQEDIRLSEYDYFISFDYRDEW